MKNLSFNNVAMENKKHLRLRVLYTAFLLCFQLGLFAQNKTECIVQGNYSHPTFSPDGTMISYTGKGMDGIFVFKEGNTTALTQATGAGYKHTWSADNTMIAYRGTFFDDYSRVQYIGVVSLKNLSDSILFSTRRLQPPVWHYTIEGMKLAYIEGENVLYTTQFPYNRGFNTDFVKSAHTNTFFYYNEGVLYMIDNVKHTNESLVKIEGMNPVMAPTRDKLLYSKEGMIVLRYLNKDKELALVKGHHPSWSPDARYFVYEVNTDDGHKITASDLHIFDTVTSKSTPLTNTPDLLEAAPVWSPDSKRIAFYDEAGTGLYIITLNK